VPQPFTSVHVVTYDNMPKVAFKSVKPRTDRLFYFSFIIQFIYTAHGSYTLAIFSGDFVRVGVGPGLRFPLSLSFPLFCFCCISCSPLLSTKTGFCNVHSQPDQCGLALNNQACWYSRDPSVWHTPRGLPPGPLRLRL